MFGLLIMTCAVYTLEDIIHATISLHVCRYDTHTVITALTHTLHIYCDVHYLFIVANRTSIHFFNVDLKINWLQLQSQCNFYALCFLPHSFLSRIVPTHKIHSFSLLDCLFNVMNKHTQPSQLLPLIYAYVLLWFLLKHKNDSLYLQQNFLHFYSLSSNITFTAFDA